MFKHRDVLVPGDLVVVIDESDFNHGWCWPTYSVAMARKRFSAADLIRIKTIVSNVPDHPARFLCVEGTYRFVADGYYEVIA